MNYNPMNYNPMMPSKLQTQKGNERKEGGGGRGVEGVREEG